MMLTASCLPGPPAAYLRQKAHQGSLRSGGPRNSVSSVDNAAFRRRSSRSSSWALPLALRSPCKARVRHWVASAASSSSPRCSSSLGEFTFQLLPLTRGCSTGLRCRRIRPTQRERHCPSRCVESTDRSMYIERIATGFDHLSSKSNANQRRCHHRLSETHAAPSAAIFIRDLDAVRLP